MPIAESPLNASLWRKLLAFRVLVLCAFGLFVAFSFIGWLDTAKPDIPPWLEKLLIVLAVFPFLAFFYALKEGLMDLLVHFMPESRVKRFLFRGGRKPEEIAKEFEEGGYAVALLPFFAPVALAVVALVVLLFVGGIAAVGALFGAVFEGWPSWAVVMTILLVLILLKK